MFPLHISLKLALSSLLILFLQADSIQLSATEVQKHFRTNHSYLYLAANYGDSLASKQLYQQTGDTSWLHMAAKQGDVESAYLWYLQNESKHKVWLDFAADSGYSKAVLKQLELLVDAKKWLAVQTLIEQRKGQNNIVLTELQDSFDEVQELVTLALKPAQEITQVHAATKQVNNLSVDYNCRIKVQPFVAKSNLVAQVTEFEQALADSAMSNLPICFNEPSTLPQLQSICKKDRLARIDCDLKKLAGLPEVIEPEQSYTHILVLVEQGEANTRGGLMFMDKSDTSDVFIHELAHWFGLVDEYKIGRLQQQQLCKVDKYGFLGLNLFVTTKDMTKVQAEKLANRKLYPAATCDGSPYKAYKFNKEPSFMQYLEKPVSNFYVTMIKEHINWSNVVPAAMNFAHVYKPNYDLYLSYIKQAAGNGYQGAITEFSQHLVEQGSYLEAKNWLEFGAEHGGTNSKLLLGHAYLEGSWLPRDLAESALWYKKAAEQNDGYGLYFYGKCLEMGWGCIQSKERAFEYYQKAAQRGNKLAKRKLKQSL